MQRRTLLKLLAMTAASASAPIALAQADTAQPRRGGTLRLALLGLDTADPHRHAGSIAVQQVYAETLTSIGDDGSVAPFLAERFTTSPDGLTYTFHLRPQVRFHNGRELTASDVQANFERVRSQVKGGWLSGAMQLVERVETPDAATVQVVLSEPYAPLLNLLSELWILAPESPGWADTITQPIGTGPFVFGTWRPDVSFEAPAFGEYWQPGLPYLDALHFDLRGERDNSLALRSGDLHVGYVANDQIPALRSGGLDVQFLKDTAWYFLSFNNRKPSPLMQDRRVREAIALAVDKRAYMNFIVPDALVSNQPVRPETYYWDAALEAADTFAKPDLARAKALLAEAGVNPAAHTLKVVSWQNDYAQVAVQMVRQLGFGIDHQALDDIGAQRLLAQYDWDLAPFNSGPRADIYLRYARLLSDGPSPMLWGGIQDPELDALIKAAVSSPSPERARAGYLRAWERVQSQLYTVGVGHAADAIGIGAKVHGYRTGYTWSQHRADGGVARTWLQA
ncbi:ABC transporter substrate-binding protein [Verticiella sediminum]|uniref:ABC transporter substrate-binding protein n=1 Tax=Verticiella sediminum TaxID=1247510 RepID=A0A556AIR7_9BURK|nr:ABC transporter substrate-binding protein [Verticiella sediminum]TSH92769.1 ABC transporter substrate-binding protein [Verticiella sediminum]